MAHVTLCQPVKVQCLAFNRCHLLLSFPPMHIWIILLHLRSWVNAFDANFWGGGSTFYLPPEAHSHPGVSLPQRKVNQRPPNTVILSHTAWPIPRVTISFFLFSPQGSQGWGIWENQSNRNYQLKGTLLIPRGGSCQGSPTSLQGATPWKPSFPGSIVASRDFLNQPPARKKFQLSPSLADKIKTIRAYCILNVCYASVQLKHRTFLQETSEVDATSIHMLMGKLRLTEVKHPLSEWSWEFDIWTHAEDTIYPAFPRNEWLRPFGLPQLSFSCSSDYAAGY